MTLAKEAALQFEYSRAQRLRLRILAGVSVHKCQDAHTAHRLRVSLPEEFSTDLKSTCELAPRIGIEAQVFVGLPNRLPERSFNQRLTLEFHRDARSGPIQGGAYFQIGIGYGT